MPQRASSIPATSCRAVASVLLSVALLLLPLSISPASSGTVAQMDPQSAITRIKVETIDVVTVQPVFWRGNWEWTEPALNMSADNNATRVDFAGRHAKTGFKVNGRISSRKGKAIQYRMGVRESSGGAVDVYGGISFRISRESIIRSGFDPQPRLEPDRTGWAMQLAPGQPPLRVTFDRPVAKLEFERGEKNEIRAYFLQKNDRVDTLRFGMEISVPGTVAGIPSTRLAQKKQDWPLSNVHWNRAPVDISFLNAAEKPAGKRGFLKSDGEKLVFEDKTEARFWGTNLSGNAIFQTVSRQTIRQQAKRLSRLGFNLVRIHHHDSAWVQPNIFERHSGGTRRLNPHALKQLDLWIAHLKEEGIYVWIDLHVGREVSATDNVDAFDEIAGGKSRGKLNGFVYVNDSLTQRMKEFAKAYLTRVNPFTGLALKDDPAVAAILITNENDVTHHYGNSLLPDKNVPWHTRKLMLAANKFAKRHRLDPGQTRRTWEHGPSRIFLADLERKFHAEMTTYLHGLGVRAPIVGTNFWGGMGLGALPSLSAGDVMDVHTYGGANEMASNPRFKPNILSQIASAAVVGKPVTVSEWNVQPFPVYDRFSVAPYLAAVASLQGWNTIAQYAYAQAPLLGASWPSNWHAYNDPAMLAMLPAAALLYRSRHVSEGQRTHYLKFGASSFFDQETSPKTSRAIRTFVERSRVRIALPTVRELDWLKPSQVKEDATIIEDPSHDALGPDVSRVCADTGEFCRNWKDGVFILDTERSQIALGWIGGKAVTLKDVSMSLQTANAAVAVQSLDQDSIATASRILLSSSAQSLPKNSRELPFRSEGIKGTIKVRARPGLKLFALDIDGTKLPRKLEYQQGWYSIRLSPSDTHIWRVLE